MPSVEAGSEKQQQPGQRKRGNSAIGAEFLGWLLQV
jgi:hypothetical protein